MNCPRCRALIVADDVNLEHLLAKCRACHAMFRLTAGESEAVTENVPSERRGRVALDYGEGALPEIRIRVPQPAWIRVEGVAGGEQRLVRKWHEEGAPVAILFCLSWNGLFGYWSVRQILSEGSVPPAFVFPVAIGMLVAYWTVACFVNATVVSLSDGILNVRHGPLPWIGNVIMPVADIRQLYCGVASWNRSPYVHVKAIMADGTTQTILRWLQRDEGLFIEQQLEDWLGIVPTRVPGQVERR
jgi:hypothetical protein